MEIEYHYLILGLIQGLTEFLPVSSSGHLLLFERALLKGIPDSSLLMINVAFHMGTLIAVIMYFWRDVYSYSSAFLSLFRSRKDSMSENQREVLMILLLSFPTGVIGLALKKMNIEAIPLWGVLIALCVTSVVCFGIDRVKVLSSSGNGITPIKAVILGLVQGIAVIPGISRSGSTIFTGLICGLSREKMASFSFLMSIPAITGAFLLELKELLELGTQDVHLFSLGAGALVAMVSGYLSLALLVRLLKGKQFKVFGWYCLLVALIGFFII